MRRGETGSRRIMVTLRLMSPPDTEAAIEVEVDEDLSGDLTGGGILVKAAPVG